MKSFFVIPMLLLAGLSARATSLPLYTDFDREIAQYADTPGLAVTHYLKNHGITEEEMIGRVESNIAEHLAAAEVNPARFNAAGNSLMTLQWMKTPKALERLEAYTNEANPVKLRAVAIRRFLFSSKLDGLNVASNVVTQAWRSSNEHDAVRNVYCALAKDARPEDCAKYVEFFKWAGTHAHFGGLIKTWDKDTIDFDPAWRTNPLRRASAEFQMQYASENEMAFNNVVSVIRDYELATGIRQLDPSPDLSSPVVAAPDVPPTTNADTASASSAVLSEVCGSAPTMHSRKLVAVLGAMLLVLLAVFVWHRRHSGKRP